MGTNNYSAGGVDDLAARSVKLKRLLEKNDRFRSDEAMRTCPDPRGPARSVTPEPVDVRREEVACVDERGREQPAVMQVAPKGSSEFGPPVTIRALDASAMDHAELAGALRTLARLMVRAHRRDGEPVANVSPETRSEGLTLAPDPSVHQVDGPS